MSPEDHAWLSRFKWNHLKVGYAARYIGTPTDGSRKMILMHREIMGFPSCEVDHINGDRLDNRRTNLRVCSRSSNAQNAGTRYPRGKYGRNVARVVGNRDKPFAVRCSFQGKPVHGGYFATVKEAQRAAAELRKKLGYFA